ncbi:unnamed protein product [Kuraishia capsulata CBS 1993]|uniref:Ribosome biogenesis protein SLX9 n=1 Tax=Kuraishia capsulata CBS 1993 TaxID=1382522 RepID=W6MJZ7_9ASCO|nr:uncharacterized protein KUCA_T00002594001 [Kuraishia capsulata CBS 1993]CDK26621.1 unnamed protein product [Kuraishia capsulata CBS 1993]
MSLDKAVKKRTTLRAKSTRAQKTLKPSSAATASKSEQIQELIQEGLEKEKAEKKGSKASTKSVSLKERLASLKGHEHNDSISKSAIRRRKRKEKAQLAGSKLDDLLVALPEELPENPEDSISFVANKPKINHTPNAHSSQRGAAKIEAFERGRFQNALKTQGFANGTFASMKDAIRQNLKNM